MLPAPSRSGCTQAAARQQSCCFSACLQPCTSLAAAARTVERLLTAAAPPAPKNRDLAVTLMLLYTAIVTPFEASLPINSMPFHCSPLGGGGRGRRPLLHPRARARMCVCVRRGSFQGSSGFFQGSSAHSRAKPPEPTAPAPCRPHRTACLRPLTLSLFLFYGSRDTGRPPCAAAPAARPAAPVLRR